jgi:hypothetical protein
MPPGNPRPQWLGPPDLGDPRGESGRSGKHMLRGARHLGAIGLRPTASLKAPRGWRRRGPAQQAVTRRDRRERSGTASPKRSRFPRVVPKGRPVRGSNWHPAGDEDTGRRGLRVHARCLQRRGVRRREHGRRWGHHGSTGWRVQARRDMQPWTGLLEPRLRQRVGGDRRHRRFAGDRGCKRRGPRGEPDGQHRCGQGRGLRAVLGCCL